MTSSDIADIDGGADSATSTAGPGALAVTSGQFRDVTTASGTAGTPRLEADV